MAQLLKALPFFAAHCLSLWFRRCCCQVFCHYYFNSHPYYHREGYWLSPDERLADGLFHLTFATALALRLLALGPAAAPPELVAARKRAAKLPAVKALLASSKAGGGGGGGGG
eukprot:SAG22_NODE_2064_length_3060_cov_3.006754_3_plen_112_part_01